MWEHQACFAGFDRVRLVGRIHPIDFPKFSFPSKQVVEHYPEGIAARIGTLRVDFDLIDVSVVACLSVFGLKTYIDLTVAWLRPVLLPLIAHQSFPEPRCRLAEKPLKGVLAYVAEPRRLLFEIIAEMVRVQPWQNSKITSRQTEGNRNQRRG